MHKLFDLLYLPSLRCILKNMLTKTDLSQIQRIVQIETRKIVKEELKPVKRDITVIKKDVALVVRTFDRDYVALRRRVEHVENHLHTAPVSP